MEEYVSLINPSEEINIISKICVNRLCRCDSADNKIYKVKYNKIIDSQYNIEQNIISVVLCDKCVSLVKKHTEFPLLAVDAFDALMNLRFSNKQQKITFSPATKL